MYECHSLTYQYEHGNLVITPVCGEVEEEWYNKDIACLYYTNVCTTNASLCNKQAMASRHHPDHNITHNPLI